ncbi:hypothetical protein MF672_018475 [Actinomadura sp. ATCC 31491]|uniref:Uncharacterized protein n=1 Tax=Actinomadura luzonensis TaxID=2805427 RepID=A0ABT0FUB6_9ACTN|nr:hypothetical protein [Actinomadura luzonensis]MCK2215763.1 hypothetical protein [Actinomadura luzonensis]
MSDKLTPPLATPVERTVVGAACADPADVHQSQHWRIWRPFADEGDE